jgi:hypothetical protein
MVKCPTCGTQIEVPATPTGQVVKCPGCGKGLKLVAKKPAGQAAGAGGGGGMGAGNEGSRGSGSPGGSVAGSSVTAMSFHGEPPPIDDLPNLESCAVCGRPTEFERLVEDNGRMVCPDCIKGARSKIARSSAPPDMIGFKQGEYRPVKRAKLVNVTPAFIGAIIAAIVWAGCQVYLSSHNKPVGTAMARPAKPPRTAVTAHEPEKPAEPAPTPATQAASQPAETVAQAPPAPAPAPAEPVAPAPASQVAIVTPPIVPEPATKGSALFSGEPDKAGPPAPAPAEMANADPVDRGIERLQARDYREAKKAFDQARQKYVLGQMAANAPLTPQQSQVFNGLVAASIGLKQFDDAKKHIVTLVGHNDHSRAMAINRALLILLGRSGGTEYNLAVPELKRYLDGAPPEDEYAVDVFGSLLGKLSAVPGVKRQDMEQLWTAWDSYVDRLASNRPNELKWGVEWLSAEQVKGYRQTRAVVGGITPDVAGKKLQTAKTAFASAQTQLENAKLQQANGRQADVVGATQRLETAKRALDEAQKDFVAAGANAVPPKWLDPDHIQPALP